MLCRSSLSLTSIFESLKSFLGSILSILELIWSVAVAYLSLLFKDLHLLLLVSCTWWFHRVSDLTLGFSRYDLVSSVLSADFQWLCEVEFKAMLRDNTRNGLSLLEGHFAALLVHQVFKERAFTIWGLCAISALCAVLKIVVRKIEDLNFLWTLFARRGHHWVTLHLGDESGGSGARLVATESTFDCFLHESLVECFFFIGLWNDKLVVLLHCLFICCFNYNLGVK